MTTDLDELFNNLRGNNGEKLHENDSSPRASARSQFVVRKKSGYKYESKTKSSESSNFSAKQLPKNIKNAEGTNTDSFYYVEMESVDHHCDSNNRNQDQTQDSIPRVQNYNRLGKDAVKSTPRSRLVPDLSWDSYKLYPKKSDFLRKSPDRNRKSPEERRSPRRGNSPKTDPKRCTSSAVRYSPGTNRPFKADVIPCDPESSPKSVNSHKTPENCKISPTRERRRKISPRHIGLHLFHAAKHSDRNVPVLPQRVLDELLSSKRQEIQNASDVMREGEVLLMVEHTRWVTRTVNTYCQVTPDMMRVNYTRRRCWTPNFYCGRIKDTFDIRSVLMARSGRHGLLRVVATDLPETRCFSIVFDDASKKTLNFVAPSEESAKFWVRGINFVKKQLETLLPRLKEELSLWEKFKKEDKHNNGYLTHPQVHEMMRNLGAMATQEGIEKVDQIFQDTGENGILHFEQFVKFYQKVTLRPEIVSIFRNYSADKTFLTARELYKFLQESQKEYEVTERDCLKTIEDYEMDEDNRASKLMSIHGFVSFIQSPYCDVFNRRHDEVYQDMRHPLSHYFIASSHNTYLTGDQLKDPSSTDSYMKALLQGCRCVELDCWDGADDDPVIFHGHTWTSKIKFKDAIEVIGKYAFEVSRYPLILSIENHCSVPQQEKMASYMQRIFGAELLTECLINEEEELHLPSPAALQGKILIKGKKLPPVVHDDSSSDSSDEEGDVSDEDEAAEMEEIAMRKMDEGKHLPRGRRLFQRRPMTSPSDVMRRGRCDESVKQLLTANCIDKDPRMSTITASTSNQSSTRTRAQEKKLKLSKSLSDQVIYCKSTKFKGIEEGMKSTCFREISSFSENKANRLATQQTRAAINFHVEHLNRTYPGATRADSSNYDPQPLWNAGFQVVALNYQTKCDEMTLYNAKFRQNGRSGYVLKPEFMTSISDDVNNNEAKTRLLVTVISGSYLPVNQSSAHDQVHVEIAISGDPRDTTRKKTGPARGRGYNPAWGEDLSFDIRVPSLAMIWFKVLDEDSERIAQSVLPFTSISEGYRTVPCLDRHGTPMRHASLLVHVATEEDEAWGTGPRGGGDTMSSNRSRRGDPASL